MTHTEECKEVFGALIAAWAEIDNAKKDAKNPAFNKNYADLASILDVSKPALAKHSLMLTCAQHTTQDGNGVVTSAILIHSSGQKITFDPVFMPVVAKTPQAVGSAMTYGRRYSILSALNYGRRYSILSALNLAAEDDDGNAASQPAARPQQKAPEPKKAPERAPEPKADAPAAGVTKGADVPKHPAWIKGGSDLATLFTSEIDGHRAFREEELVEYRKEYAKIGHVNPEVLPARVDKFIADVKAELLKRSEVSPELAPLTAGVTVEDAPADANPLEIF